jgi:hypothetical protein
MAVENARTTGPPARAADTAVGSARQSTSASPKARSEPRLARTPTLNPQLLLNGPGLYTNRICMLGKGARSPNVGATSCSTTIVSARG